MPSWSGDFGAPDAAAMLGTLDPRAPVSVYVHVPFCAQQCSYCGCNMVVARQQAAGDRYLDALEAQLASLPLPAPRLPLARLHLGGGTPTWLTPEQLRRLFSLVRTRFSSMPGCARSVEVDPEVTTPAHLDALAAAKVGRISLGVQSFEPAVLQAVGRPQATDQVVAVVEGARARGIGSVNLDLMYGLPHQTTESFGRTLDQALALRPDRFAVFGYAHVPWLKPHQERLEAHSLPGPRERADLMLLAQERLLAAGYVAIGFDHFALPDDALAIAASEKHLHRDFMGYTERSRTPLVGLGPSAISELDGGFFQQESKLGPWLRAVREGRLPIVRGLWLSDDDRLRRDAILALTCVGHVDFASLGAQHRTDAHRALADVVDAMSELVDEGLVRWDGRVVRVTELGRLAVRRVAMRFDATLGTGGRFSRVV